MLFKYAYKHTCLPSECKVIPYNLLVVWRRGYGVKDHKFFSGPSFCEGGFFFSSPLLYLPQPSWSQVTTGVGGGDVGLLRHMGIEPVHLQCFNHSTIRFPTPDNGANSVRSKQRQEIER